MHQRDKKQVSVKRLLVSCVLLLLCTLSLISQERGDVVVYITPVTGEGSTPEDNAFFHDLTAMEVGARGYTLREGDIPYDYAFEGSLGRIYLGAEEWFFHLEVKEIATDSIIVEQEISFKKREDVYEFFPVLIFTMLANIPLTKQTGDAVAVEPPPEYWLYAGLRMGSSLRFYTRDTAAPFVEKDVFHWYNINFAIHASYNFWRFLSVQGDLIISNEYAPFRVFETATGSLVVSDASFNTMSLMLPVTLKASLRKEPLFSASVLAGIYLAFPMSNMQNEHQGDSFPYMFTPPLGYTLGINMGFKAGPGYVFIDIRWAQDFGQAVRADNSDPLFGRSMLVLALGYEKGFFPKKKSEPRRPAASVVPPAANQSE